MYLYHDKNMKILYNTNLSKSEFVRLVFYNISRLQFEYRCCIFSKKKYITFRSSPPKGEYFIVFFLKMVFRVFSREVSSLCKLSSGQVCKIEEKSDFCRIGPRQILLVFMILLMHFRRPPSLASSTYIEFKNIRIISFYGPFLSSSFFCVMAKYRITRRGRPR